MCRGDGGGARRDQLLGTKRRGSATATTGQGPTWGALVNIRTAGKMVTGVAVELRGAEARAWAVRTACASSMETLLSLEEQLAGLGAVATQIQSYTADIAAIALNTRMLSLNAAIEAAHAGEAGAGFGVVATAIRDLSRDTNQATAGIATHLEKVTRAVEHLREAHEKLHLDMTHVDDEAAALAAKVHEQGEVVVAARRCVKEALDQAKEALGPGALSPSDAEPPGLAPRAPRPHAAPPAARRPSAPPRPRSQRPPAHARTHGPHTSGEGPHDP